MNKALFNNNNLVFRLFPDLLYTGRPKEIDFSLFPLKLYLFKYILKLNQLKRSSMIQSENRLQTNFWIFFDIQEVYF